MSASAGTIGAPRRTRMGRASRQVLEVVLVLAISFGIIVALATLHRPVGVDDRSGVTEISGVDARWTPKWAAATHGTTGEASIVDLRWTAKEGRAEAAEGPDRSEARGSEAG